MSFLIDQCPSLYWFLNILNTNPACSRQEEAAISKFHMLISQDCCNKLPKTGWIKTTDTYLFIYFVFLGQHPRRMEVPRLEIQLELSLLAYTPAIATQDPSHVCNLHHSLWQRWILNPLSKARVRTCLLMDVSQIHFCWIGTGTPRQQIFIVSQFRRIEFQNQGVGRATLSLMILEENPSLPVPASSVHWRSLLFVVL